MTVDASGNTWVVGKAISGTTSKMALWRYDASGANTKTVVAPYADSFSNHDIGVAVAVDANGKIVVVGATDVTDTFDKIVVWRFNSDGTPDTSFNAAGTTPGVRVIPTATANSFSGSTTFAYPRAVALDGSGKIVLLGQYGGSPVGAGLITQEMAVLRINADGTVDTSFNPSGTTPGAVVIANAGSGGMMIDHCGNILVAGELEATGSHGTAVALWRLTDSGQLDTSFNSSGTTPGLATNNTVASNITDIHGNGLVMDAGGKIDVAGTFVSNGGSNQLGLWRFNADGTLDTTFNAAGTVPGTAAVTNAAANAITLDASGRILVAGQSATNMALYRFTANGLADTSFNATGVTPGVVVAPLTMSGATSDAGYALATDANGKILVTGSSSNSSASELVLWRFNP